MILLKKNTSIFSYALIIICSCSQENHKDLIANKFEDPVIVQINEQKFNAWRSHLYNSLELENPSHKAEAILSFASLGDNTAFSKCGEYLEKSPDQLVRLTAALYLGKLNGNESTKFLSKALLQEEDHEVKKQVLIGLAKTVNISQVELIKDFYSENNTEREGHCLSLIILKNRFYSDAHFGKIAIRYLTDTGSSLSVRLLSSQFLSMADSFEIAPQEKDIIQAITIDKSPDVVSNLIVSLSKLQKKTINQVFEFNSSSKESIVRLACLYGLSGTKSAQREQFILQSLNDSIPSVRIAASEIIKEKFTEFASLDFLAEARKQNQWYAKLNLYEAAYRLTKDSGIPQELIEIYKTQSDPIKKSVCIRVIGLSSQHFSFLKTQLLSDTDPLIKTSCAMALATLNLDSGFPDTLRDEFMKIYQEGINQGDPAVAAIFSNALKDPYLKYYEQIHNSEFLTAAYKRFIDQDEITAAQAIERVLAKTENRSSTELNYEVKGPVWDSIRAIGTDQKVVIKTSKGEIVVKLLVDNSPVAVSNFLQLVRDKYYDNTYVFNVTNSIIQAGCARGDGFGGKGYALPYEAGTNSYGKPTLNVTPTGSGFHSTQWYMLLNPHMNHLGKSLPIGVVETDISLLKRLEHGDKIHSVYLLNRN